MSSKLDRDVAARRSAENCESKQRINPANAALKERSNLFFAVCNATQRATHHRPDSIAIFRGEIETRIIECHCGTYDGKMSEPIQPLCLLMLEMIGGNEVVHFGSVVAAKWSGIESRQGSNR
jgi:hypothetical protein